MLLITDLFTYLGIHAILKSGNKLSYVVYNLSTGRYVQDCYIPSDISSFLGLQPQNINLTSAGEVYFIDNSISEIYVRYVLKEMLSFRISNVL